ncbi:MAG: serine/threonine protein phosphatase, partial [Planctomycetota bacterium]
MDGVDLVTEGVVTLQRMLSALQAAEPWNGGDDTPLDRLCSLLMDSDGIDILLGAGVNQAHHAPDLPAELRDRRRLVEELAGCLRSRYCKAVHIELL